MPNYINLTGGNVAGFQQVNDNLDEQIVDMYWDANSLYLEKFDGTTFSSQPTGAIQNIVTDVLPADSLVTTDGDGYISTSTALSDGLIYQNAGVFSTNNGYNYSDKGKHFTLLNQFVAANVSNVGDSLTGDNDGCIWIGANASKGIWNGYRNIINIGHENLSSIAGSTYNVIVGNDNTPLATSMNQNILVGFQNYANITELTNTTIVGDQNFLYSDTIADSNTIVGSYNGVDVYNESNNNTLVGNNINIDGDAFAVNAINNSVMLGDFTNGFFNNGVFIGNRKLNWNNNTQKAFINTPVTSASEAAISFDGNSINIDPAQTPQSLSYNTNTQRLQLATNSQVFNLEGTVDYVLQVARNNTYPFTTRYSVPNSVSAYGMYCVTIASTNLGSLNTNITAKIRYTNLFSNSVVTKTFPNIFNGVSGDVFNQHYFSAKNGSNIDIEMEVVSGTTIVYAFEVAVQKVG
jgi:hypothetical protein